MRSIQLTAFFVLTSVMMAPTIGHATEVEWTQGIQPNWLIDDAAQGASVTVISGETYNSTNLKQYKVGSQVPQWTELPSRTDIPSDVIASADVETTYELALPEPITVVRLDLWLDNSSEYRNAADVEIEVSKDGITFEPLVATGNRLSTKNEEGTCNVLSVDFAGHKEPVSAIRIKDKVAVTCIQGPHSPRWLQWDVIQKK